ncbi:MAG TPA: hypothetical protein VG225_00175 [Terracidiphilus sp.]|jgi:hypothetical protein|nr:hypothetical protein [Terracidiphilus sp.]
MGQFDSETSAALAQLNYDALSETPGGEFAEIIGDLLMLIGSGGLCAVAGGASNLLQKIRKLAGASYASNLTYAITAVSDDLATLYERNEILRGRIESLRTDPQFAEAIVALALRAMHTSVKDRLKRLARIVVNGVKEDDLSPEGLDDMMRAAVELGEADIRLLEEIYEHPVPMDMNEADKGRTDSAERMGSIAKLQAVAFVQLRTPGFDSGANIVVLLPNGAKFYERLQEIAVQK